MLIVALTGSIGMGKSTTSKMFMEAGVPVHDADQAVHDLYKEELVGEIEAAFPGSTDKHGVNRTLLSKHVVGNEIAMKTLEAIVHPAVQAKKDEFLKRAKNENHHFVILDIPLLFETGGDKKVDKIIVVSADFEIQKARVLAREGMSLEKFEAILKRQLPDEEKRKRADFIVKTDEGMDSARQQVDAIIRSLKNI